MAPLRPGRGERGRLKTGLAAEFGHDRERYTAAKVGFIRRIVSLMP